MRNLITVDDYKLYTNISSTDQDDKFEMLVTLVSSFVKDYCGRSFIDNYNVDTEAYLPITQYFNGGDDTVYTDEFPLVGITSVSYSTDYGQNYTSLVEYTDFVLDRQHNRVKLFGGDLVDSPNYYKIIYTGGYIETPSDLKLACLDLMEYYVKRESTPRKTNSSVSIEYVRGSELPGHIKRVLDLYRVLK